MKTRASILLIEDEFTLGEIIRESLEQREMQVRHFTRGEEGLRHFILEKPELLILDVMLPDADGFALARQIRQFDQETPILFLTAKSLPHQVVEGFESGGNDYLKKPFSLEELVVRIKVLLSRDRLLVPDQVPRDLIELGDYLFFSKRQLLQYKDQHQKLSAREAELLSLLCGARNRVIDRKTILLRLWNDDHLFNSRSLDVFISRLRKYLSHDSRVQIINYRGIGYKLITD